MYPEMRRFASLPSLATTAGILPEMKEMKEMLMDREVLLLHLKCCRKQNAGSRSGGMAEIADGERVSVVLVMGVRGVEDLWWWVSVIAGSCSGDSCSIDGGSAMLVDILWCWICCCGGYTVVCVGCHVWPIAFGASR